MEGSTSDLRLDITDDLSEAQLSEIAICEDIVVYWHENEAGHPYDHPHVAPADAIKRFGVITGWHDPTDSVEVYGHFDIAQVQRRRGEDPWHEIGRTRQLMRSQFVVFGPAGDYDGQPRPQQPHEAAVERLPDVADKHWFPHLCAILDLTSAGSDGWPRRGEGPLFRVRLDIDPGGLRAYRLVVRATKSPNGHDRMLDHTSIRIVLDVAERHGLVAEMTNVGIELQTADD